MLAINDFHGGEADYFHLVFWNGKATALCEYKSKGDMIAVEGYLKTRSYTDKDNVIRNIVEVIVEETDFLGKTKTQEQEPMPDLNPNHKSQEEWKLINDAKENLSEEDAQTYVDESNLLQRGFNELKISEQARVISRRYFEMFSQGKRNDIINEIRMLSGDAPLEKKPNSREKVGEEYGLSRNTIARLVRISKLIDNIKPWIDSKSISVRAGVELSYLDEDAQSLLYDFNSNEDGTMKYKISETQAKDLRILYDDCKKVEDKFNTTMISRVLVVKKKKPDKKISVKPDTYLKYFKDKNADEVQEILEQALQQYFNF